ncbi:hypothetical protein GCM10010129_57240 [Streptomyces fumigatiscleroticus]|nr:hypothetical protein GCM10010129_57240 [Streptomyces fumigatiscleroticus]
MNPQVERARTREYDVTTGYGPAPFTGRTFPAADAGVGPRSRVVVGATGAGAVRAVLGAGR